MRILLTGRNGQVGWELGKALAPLGELTAFAHADLDLRDLARIRDTVREAKPDVIVNAAAYTSVDRAESERGLAFAVNAEAPGVLAEEAKRAGALLVHYSTDYVFDGTKALPYVEKDAPRPLNVYGKSKFAGEQAVIAVRCRYLILRTGWVYGARGNNFLLTVLRLAKERSQLRVVSDQIGAPTWCRELALGTASILPRALDEPSLDGVYHVTNAGEASWHGFAAEVLQLAGILTPVYPIASSEFPTPARRPANSRLDNAKLQNTFGVRLPDWRTSLADCMKDVR